MSNESNPEYAITNPTSATLLLIDGAALLFVYSRTFLWVNFKCMHKVIKLNYLEFELFD